MNSLRSVDPPTGVRESGIENAGRSVGPERFNMSARSIDRPTEPPYFRRTSSPTRAPIVVNYALRSGPQDWSSRDFPHRSSYISPVYTNPFLSFSLPFIPPFRARTDSIFAVSLQRKFH